MRILPEEQPGPLRELAEQLLPLLGCRVMEARLGIWPDGVWPVDEDTWLNLVLSCRLQRRSVIFRTEWSGNTPPLILADELTPRYHFTQLADRIRQWKQHAEREEYVRVDREVFDLRASPEYGWLIGEQIESFEIICEADDFSPQGILIHFAGGGVIQSCAGTDGNSITAYFSDKYLMEPLVLVLVDGSTLAGGLH